MSEADKKKDSGLVRDCTRENKSPGRICHQRTGDSYRGLYKMDLELNHRKMLSVMLTGGRETRSLWMGLA